MGLWSVTAMVLPADPRSFVDVVVKDMTGKASLDTEGAVRLPSCDQTLSRMPKDQNK